MLDAVIMAAGGWAPEEATDAAQAEAEAELEGTETQTDENQESTEN